MIKYAIHRNKIVQVEVSGSFAIGDSCKCRGSWPPLDRFHNAYIQNDIVYDEKKFAIDVVVKSHREKIALLESEIRSIEHKIEELEEPEQ